MAWDYLSEKGLHIGARPDKFKNLWFVSRTKWTQNWEI